MNSEIQRIKSVKKFHSIGIPAPILVTFLFYIGSLTITQTVYGLPFLTLRWVALGTFTLVSFIYWLFGRIPRIGRTGYRGDPGIVFIYLGATLLSVATAENYQFSGLKWLTQAMMIVCCMVFLRGTFNPERNKDLSLPLKVLSLLLLLISIFFPAPLTIYDNPYFRGAMGDSNSLGHVSAICALVYLQGGITARSKRWRLIQYAVGAFAVAMLIRTAARSSAVAFIVGLVLISVYFNLTRSLLTKAAVFLFAALIFASPMLQSTAIKFIAKERKQSDRAAQITDMEAYIKNALLPSSLLATRERLWTEAWEGFIQRPFLGWGFGANANIAREWSIGPTSFGMIRDITNDVLFTLEGSGLVGFFAYLGLMFSVLRQSPTRQQLILIRRRFRNEAGLASLRSNGHDSIPEKPTAFRPEAEASRTDQRERIPEDFALSRAYIQSQMYILSVSLFVLFFFDGSAFSAGSLISAIFWVSAGAANLTRMEVVASERIDRRAMNGFKNSRGQGFK